MLIGMATAVHVLSEFYGLRTAGLNAKDSCVKLIRNLLKPIFFTCLTTSIGFSALYVTKLVPVKEFAIIAAFIPLIFWPGYTGQFMKYLPMTVFFVLCASFFYAMIITPVIGTYFGQQKSVLSSKRFSR